MDRKLAISLTCLLLFFVLFNLSSAGEIDDLIKNNIEIDSRLDKLEEDLKKCGQDKEKIKIIENEMDVLEKRLNDNHKKIEELHVNERLDKLNAESLKIQKEIEDLEESLKKDGKIGKNYDPNDPRSIRLGQLKKKLFDITYKGLPAFELDEEQFERI